MVCFLLVSMWDIYKKQMNKIFTLTATLSVFISIQPVSAVDYVACREMLRTKNEMIYLAKEKDRKYPDMKKCPTYIKWLNIESKKDGYETYTDTITGEIQPISIPFNIRFDCLSKAKSYTTDFGLFYSKEAISFAKGAENVIKDMKKARCPYQ